MDDATSLKSGTWRTTHGDMTDEEWALIADLVEPYSSRGRMGRPVKNDRRDVVNAIFYVAATGCQWRALPASYPHWNTVHRYPPALVARRHLGDDLRPPAIACPGG